MKLDEMSKDEIQKLTNEVYQRITEEKLKLQPLIEGKYDFTFIFIALMS